jgi:hypothetical protein
MTKEITRRIAAAYARGVYEQSAEFTTADTGKPNAMDLATLAVTAKDKAEEEYDVRIRMICDEDDNWSFE